MVLSPFNEVSASELGDLDSEYKTGTMLEHEHLPTISVPLFYQNLVIFLQTPLSILIHLPSKCETRNPVKTNRKEH